MVARKNQLRLLLCFLMVDLSQPLCMRKRQQLCSLAERYSAVFHELKVVMISLYRMLGGKDHIHLDQPFPIPDSAKMAIRLWRVILLHSEYDMMHGCISGRDISYFSPSSLIKATLEFDGSIQLACVASGSVPFPSNFFPVGGFIPSFQNAVELTALNCALVHAINRGFRNCSIAVRGDSDTVLHWTEGDHFRSEIATPPIILFLCLCYVFFWNIY